MLDVPKKKKKDNVTVLSSGTDITLNSVWITYDSTTFRWNVTGGGYWANTNWYADGWTGLWTGYSGETKNQGGVDSVGITYYRMYNPSHGDGRYGVAFDYQDKLKMKNACM